MLNGTYWNCTMSKVSTKIVFVFQNAFSMLADDDESDDTSASDSESSSASDVEPPSKKAQTTKTAKKDEAKPKKPDNVVEDEDENPTIELVQKDAAKENASRVQTRSKKLVEQVEVAKSEKEAASFEGDVTEKRSAATKEIPAAEHTEDAEMTATDVSKKKGGKKNTFAALKAELAVKEEDTLAKDAKVEKDFVSAKKGGKTGKKGADPSAKTDEKPSQGPGAGKTAKKKAESDIPKLSEHEDNGEEHTVNDLDEKKVNDEKPAQKSKGAKKPDAAEGKKSKTALVKKTVKDAHKSAEPSADGGANVQDQSVSEWSSDDEDGGSKKKSKGT